MATNEQRVDLTIQNNVRGQKKLETYLTTIKAVKSELQGLPKKVLVSPQGMKDYTNQLDDINKSLDKMAGRFKETEKHSKNAFNIGKIYLYAKALGSLARVFGSLTDKSSSYVENINLYQVAFDGAYQGADRFINKVSEMYGLDESQLTKSVGIFKQLTNAMNIAADTGERLSLLLTQMSIDISSLYNVDIDRAVSVLQSALSGQTRPVRSVTGADVTVGTLQQELNNLNIDRYVNSLSYAEKRLLIVISLTKQLSEATNDFGRTINCGTILKRIVKNFVNLCKKGVNILKNIFANGENLCMTLQVQ